MYLIALRFCLTYWFLHGAMLSASPSYFEMSEGITSVYSAVWQMDFEEAYATSYRVKQEEPQNLLIHHIENYIDFAKIIFTDDNRLVQDFKAAAQDRIDNIKNSEKEAPYYYYSQAEIYLQRALIRTKYDEPIRGAMDINRAYKMLKKCKAKYPEFRYADKSLGIIHILSGSIKGFKKTLLSIFTSLDGTVEGGLKEIEQLYLSEQNRDHLWSNEVILVHGLVTGHIRKDWNNAYKILSTIDLHLKSSPAGKYLLADAAYRAGNNQEVINHLHAHAHAQPNVLFPMSDFLLGKALLNKLDPRADTYLRAFLKNHKGQSKVKAAFQKLAWYELVINDDLQGYKKWMSQCQKIDPVITGEDQEANRSARMSLIPDRNLLRSRLLFDGGYYDQAKNIIDQFDLEKSALSEQLEYYYRKGRILQMSGPYKEAEKYFQNVIASGKNEDSYFACNAALQLAYMSYDRSAYDKARRFAQMTLDINPAERKDDIHNAARLLLERLLGNTGS